MLAKRIIPCLDIKGNEVVKGINFLEIHGAGDPLTLAKKYNDELADELMFLDITASHEKRKTLARLVRKLSEAIFIPFSVGGGISSLEDIRNLLNAGADKVSINTSAVISPGIIDSAAKRFGSSTIVVAIDAKKIGEKYLVFTHGGRNNSGKDAVEWAREAYDRGAGEILLTSMDRDGTKEGYEINLTSRVVKSVRIPVIASGGAKDAKDMEEVFVKADASAALAASIFHYGETGIKDVKKYLKSKGLHVRL